MIRITSADQPELQVYSRLTEAQLRNRLEPEKGIFIAESPKVINTALDCGLVPVSLLCSERKIDSAAKQVIDRCGDIPVYTGNDDILETISGFRLTRGVLCAMRRPSPITAEDVCRSARRLAVLENIADATNVGAIFRSAAALGVDGIVLTPSCSDPLNRRTVRVSMGTVFQVPWCYLPGDEKDKLHTVLDPLRNCGFTLIAAALTDDSIPLGDERLSHIEKAAVVLGTEGDGLAQRTIADCDLTVKIPMYHGVDSLNVSAAAAVLFWELRKK